MGVSRVKTQSRPVIEGDEDRLPWTWKGSRLPGAGGLPAAVRGGPCRAAAVGALAILLAVSPVLATTWHEHYEQGQLFLQSQKWAEAVQEFDAAIKLRAEPGFWLKIRGSNRINYLPYLKLGIAYLNMGEYDKALKAFESEESYGAVQRSESDMRNLETLREMARVEMTRPESAGKDEQLYAYVENITTTTAGGEERQIQARYYITAEQLVEKSLENARARERDEGVAGAIKALGPGLAVRPDDPDLKRTLKRLQTKLAEEESRRKEMELVAGKLQGAREALAIGSFETASSILSEAIAVDPENQEVQALLDEAQTKLREQVEARRTEETRQLMIQKGLSDAAALEEEGRLSQAMERLQVILALDPTNAEAMSLQRRLVERRNALDAERARLKEVARLLTESTDLIRKGAYTEAVPALNRIIALDPGNGMAQSHLAKAFAAMNEEFLARAAQPQTPKLPPVIALANSATATDSLDAAGGDAAPEERVSASDFVLAGIILDDQPDLKLTFFPGEGSQSPRDLSEPKSLSLPGERIGNLYRYQFAEPFRLRAGLSLVRIIASDSDGLDAEVVHRVRYVPPLWRSPWLYGITGLALAATLGSVQGVRIHRRNRLRKRGFNPYVAGAPVLSEDLFMGRDQLVSRVLRSVHNNSILLFGERRIGKTSLQHHLKRRLRQIEDPEYEFFPVYIDLQGTPQERFFGTIAADIFQELGPLLGDLGPDPRLAEGLDYSYENFVRDVRKVLKVLRGRTGKKVKVVLHIDEVDELNDYNPKINQKLRSLFMKSFAEEMVAVVSGVGIKKQWDSEGSPWYNFFEEIEVRSFDRKDAAALIEKPIKGVFGLENGVVDRIIETTDCKPYLIQKMCISLVNRLYEDGRKRIAIADVEAVGRPPEE